MPYYAKGAPFRYKGAVNVEDCITSRQVMEESGLDFTVEKCRLFAEMTPNQKAVNNNKLITDFNESNQLKNYGVVDNAYGIYRTDYNIPLGLVKERYEPVQNVDAFRFFDDAIGLNKAIWQTAGFFGRGERIFVSAKLPDDILVHGDKVDSYLVFTNSHDGSTGVKILFTPIRVICQNTLNAAIRTSTNYISFRHTKNVHSNINIASEILGICSKQTTALNEYYNLLFKTKVNDKIAVDVFGDIVLTTDELTKIKATGHTVEEVANHLYFALNDAEISTQKANVLSGMVDYYNMGIGQKEIIGTGWGVYNAVSGYYSNVDNNEGQKRMDTLLYGDRANKIAKVPELVLARAA